MVGNGAIVEYGLPFDLLDQNGAFADLWRTHSSAAAGEAEAHGGVPQGAELR